MKATQNPYVVYGKIDSRGYIIAVNSSAFLTDPSGWMEIDRGYGDKYHHAQGNYFLVPICTDEGAFRYKLENGKVMECSMEEVAEQVEKICIPTEKTIEERVATLEKGVSEVKNLFYAFMGKSMQ